MVVNIAASAVLAYGSPLYYQTPYHTSALSGAAWVNKLMTGHPECICCELGVDLHVFKLIMAYLQIIGVEHSRGIFLEEQLAIFLYKSVTWLSIHHVGEQFQ